MTMCATRSWAGKTPSGSRAILRGADLTDAILTDAILRGADLAGAVLRGIRLTADARLIHVGPIGSRWSTATIVFNGDGIHIVTGCFTGTLASFLEAAEEAHHDNEHGRAYRAMADFVRRLEVRT